MGSIWLGLLAILVGYLLGSIPWAYIITRWKTVVDVREADTTHNAGTASVIRQVGKRYAVIVGSADAAKGAATVLIALALQLTEPWVLAAALAAVIGHSFPVYIKFRGGQGMATLIGIYLVLAPWAALTLLALIGIVLFFMRNIFLSMVTSGPWTPLLVWVYGGSMLLIGFSLFIVVFMVLRNFHGFVQFKEVKLANPFTRNRERP